jgi:hypothetical protein
MIHADDESSSGPRTAAATGEDLHRQHWSQQTNNYSKESTPK